MKNIPRIIAIGLDGTPYSLISTYSKKGLLPNITKIINRGSLKQMTTVLPDISSVAWSSFMTGKNPGKHGIYGFYDINSSDYSIYFNNFFNLREPVLWDIISDEIKKPSVIINMPSTYPAKPMNGVFISGFVAVNIEKSIYPEYFIPELLKLNYKTDVDFNKISLNPVEMFDEINNELETKAKVVDLLWNKTDWQLFMCVITGTDRLQHYFMDSYENENSSYKNKFEEYYRKVDEFIGYIVGKTSESDCIYIFSDHGFEVLRQEVYLNNLFKQNNLLEDIGEELKCFKNLSDKSLLFNLDPGRIYINKLPRFSKTIDLSQNTYDLLINQLKQILLNLKHNENNVIKEIISKEEIYSGKCVNNAPDFILIPQKGFSLKSNLNCESNFGFNTKHTGTHNYHDAFLATNIPLKLNQTPTILDLTPTILNLLMIDIQKYDFDGKIL